MLTVVISVSLATWSASLGAGILAGESSLEDLERVVAEGDVDPRPVSGRQELLENLVNQRIWSADAPSGAKRSAGS